MKSRITLFLIACAAAVITSQGAEPIKVLLVTGGGWHDYSTQKRILTETIETKLHATVDVKWTTTEQHPVSPTENKLPHLFTQDFAEGYDVVLHNHCHTGFSGDDAINAAIDHQLKHKVGIILTHGSFHTFRASPQEAWDRIKGCKSKVHVHHAPLDIKIVNDRHPVTSLLGVSGWSTENGELYTTHLLPNTTSLAEGTTLKGRTKTDSCIFAHTVGDSRVVGITLGHHNSTMEQKEYRELMALSVLWAAGKIGADGTIEPGYRK